MEELEKTVVILEDRLQLLLNQLGNVRTEEVPIDTVPFINNNSFSSLASIIDDPVVIINQNENIVYTNKHARLLFDINEFSTSGDVYTQFIENDSLVRFLDDLTEFVVGGSISKNTSDKLLTFKNENHYAKNVKVKFSVIEELSSEYLLMIFSPFKNSFDYNANEKLTKADDKIYDDLDELTKKAEELVGYNSELKRSTSKLQQSNANKDKMFKLIAHDLKNPFNAILGLTEILKDDEELTPNDISTIADRIHSSSKRVLALIEDLLDWARLQTNHIKVNLEKFLLDEIIYENIYLQKDCAMKKNIEIEASTTKGLSVNADINMSNTVVRNLISNAIKFTSNGGKVKISTFVENNLANITVSDTGIGITDEEINKILDPNEHFTNLGTNKEKGTGLGLILCKEFIELNEGEFSISSQKNKGSSFSFSLPLAI